MSSKSGGREGAALSKCRTGWSSHLRDVVVDVDDELDDTDDVEVLDEVVVLVHDTILSKNWYL